MAPLLRVSCWPAWVSQKNFFLETQAGQCSLKRAFGATELRETYLAIKNGTPMAFLPCINLSSLHSSSSPLFAHGQSCFLNRGQRPFLTLGYFVLHTQAQGKNLEFEAEMNSINEKVRIPRGNLASK